jgi:hypothetical protein
MASVPNRLSGFTDLKLAFQERDVVGPRNVRILVSSRISFPGSGSALPIHIVGIFMLAETPSNLLRCPKSWL